MTGDPMTNERLNNEMGAEPRISTAIDAALRSVGSATPQSGLEGRILTRLASHRILMETEPAPAGRFARWPRFPARALGLVTACLMGFVIVAGSVSHSRKIRPAQMVTPPSLVLPGHGIGAASAVHPAAPASAPMPPGQAARGRSSRRAGQGRARIAPHTPKAPGVAVPAPASNSPSPDSPN